VLVPWILNFYGLQRILTRFRYMECIIMYTHNNTKIYCHKDTLLPLLWHNSLISGSMFLNFSSLDFLI